MLDGRPLRLVLDKGRGSLQFVSIDGNRTYPIDSLVVMLEDEEDAS